MRVCLADVVPGHFGDGESGTTGAAVSGADTRLGRRCRYGDLKPT